jgi:dynein heavy chain
MALADSGVLLLQTWKEYYLKTRDKIEQSGKRSRWEFDRSKLFPKTDYVAVIAGHLSEIAVLLMEFQNFFGPEIKAVVGDPKKIEEALKKAFSLVKPFVEITFDPFLASNQRSWSDLLDQLRKEVALLEAEAKSFIDEAFVTIR